jgi:MoaA/NifB/PqqE/SkfB family radical SAM enzyme
MKQAGYTIANSIGYLKVMAKEREWQCKPWAMVNIDPNGNLVLPCYVHNDYTSNTSIFQKSIKNSVSDFDWKKIKHCRKCSLHCYVEPSLVLSGDFKSYMHWAFHINL